MIKVSICIPAYENGKGIKRLLDSIFEQTYANYEIVITDDSRTDVVKKTVELYRDNRIKYYKDENKGNSTDNWNLAIQKSQGEYIKMMHHDDWFTEPDSLEKFVLMLDNHPDVDLAFSGSRQVGNKIYDRYMTLEQEKKLQSDWRYVFCHNKIGAPSAVIHRNKDFLYDSKLKWLVDCDLYMCILEKNPKYIFSTEPLVSIGIGDEQITNQCVKDPELIVNENCYLYNKFGLKKSKECQRKLEQVLYMNGVSWENFKKMEISLPFYWFKLLKGKLKK